jgi:hypothetical protein
VFQELSHRAPTLRNAALRFVPNGVRRITRRSRRGWAAPMTMDGIPREKVTALIRAAGGEVVDERVDGSGEPVWKGYRYTVSRPAAR